MKKIVHFFYLLLLFPFVDAQNVKTSVESVPWDFSGKGGCVHLDSKEKEPGDHLRVRNSVRAPAEIFYVLNGIPVDEEEIKKIEPNNVVSIDILRPLHITTYCRPINPLIVIVTDTASQRTIIVKDAETGLPLPAASIELSYGDTENEKLGLIADKAGCVVTDKIVFGKECKLKVSSVGYHNFTSIVSSKYLERPYTVMLQKDYRQLSEVVIVIPTGKRTGCCVTSFCRSMAKRPRVNADISALWLAEKIYPNPVQRSQKINIELLSKYQSGITVKLFSLDGKLVGAAEYRTEIGINRLSYSIHTSLAAGLYSIQLSNRAGRPFKIEKLIIQ